ncbi:phage baseplate plug family protein [Enterococcus faecalis]|uniref:phage baseplate plug family protein n=1 Tax=Enterococcus faecalis TaxID=1351 RepID=UPI001E5F029E|nr:hypothetical protein [Enterococcus faecalis]MCD5030859.1 hypothetical protein [Enterococcus faecalis]
MSLRAYIPIDKYSLPERFEIPLGNTHYIFEVDYNRTEQFFTVDLYDMEFTPLVIGEQMVINERLWQDIVDTRLPSADLIPMDESGSAKEITFENFGVQVFLYIDDLPPNYDVPSLEREDT